MDIKKVKKYIIGFNTDDADKKRDVIQFIEQQEKYAELGRSVNRGVAEIMPHTDCMGVYKSDACNNLNKYTYGCVLKYYCDLQAEVNS